MKSLSSVGLVIAALALGMPAGCATNDRSSSGDPAVERVNLSLEPSTRDMLVGETVTIMARTQDTYGRDSQLNWTSTAGTLSTEQNGRVARVRFDKPGTYTVSAVLTIDGREARRETVEVRVKPLS